MSNSPLAAVPELNNFNPPRARNQPRTKKKRESWHKSYFPDVGSTAAPSFAYLELAEVASSCIATPSHPPARPARRSSAAPRFPPTPPALLTKPGLRIKVALQPSRTRPISIPTIVKALASSLIFHRREPQAQRATRRPKSRCPGSRAAGLGCPATKRPVAETYSSGGRAALESGPTCGFAPLADGAWRRLRKRGFGSQPVAR